MYCNIGSWQFSGPCNGGLCHGEPGGCRDRILQGGLWGRFFYPISEAEIGISYMQRGRDRTPSFLRNMV